MSADFSSVLIEGPWSHDFVSANGARFHVVQAGPADSQAPLVLFLHSFPQFWWAWRHQLVTIGEAGYRAVAMDLRGVGASDKPPSGYDVPTRTRDVAGVIRSLGTDHAIVVGHGTGAGVAWAMAALQPAVTEAVVAIAGPHPARLHRTTRSAYTPAARLRLAYLQLPNLPERALTRGGLTRTLLEEWSTGRFTPDELETYETAINVPFAAHSSLEAVRWLVRSTPRPDGYRFRTRLRRPLFVPALQLQGEQDPVIVPDGVDVDAAALCRDYRFELLPGTHFLPEELPGEVSDLLLGFLDGVSRA